MIKEEKKLKIPSIAELEQKLLADSTTVDMALPDDAAQDADRVLTAAQVRHDVSTVARALINVYGGWPFFDDVEKRRILTRLNEILKNTHDMTAAQLFEHLAPVIQDFKDCHIRIQLGDLRAATRHRHVAHNVGKNIAGSELLKIEMRGNIAVIAIKALRDIENTFIPRKQDAIDAIKSSDALVVDLRGNCGGNSMPTDWLAEYLYGAAVPSANKSFIRVTSDAAIVHARKAGATDWIKIPRGTAPALLTDDSGEEIPAFESNAAGYRKPIYVLIDARTSSSAEMFCTKIMPHPNVKFVGDNTAGCEVYGDIGHVILPGSKIRFSFGCIYRELARGNIETIGYAPDIHVADGVDAFDVAMRDFAARRMMTVDKNGWSL